jgi:DNA-binding LacI/PurR family transcriptional regulator/signal transduction histidine kinase
MKNKKIAFFIDYIGIENTFQLHVLDGVVAVLPEDGVELYIVVGGAISNFSLDRYSDRRNAIYELITKEMFDGIIVSTSVGTYTSKEIVSDYLERFDGIPIVFLGPGPENYTQILVDNRKGMEEIVHHFIFDHHYKRIAFIRGPEGNVEAEGRFTAYKTQLAEAGLSFDPELVYTGNFLSDTGTKAVIAFLDERKVHIDAIIASNDAMVFGAKKELERRGYAIPMEIAIAGFDDTIESSSMLPNITTARQPFALIVKKIFEKLIATIEGKTVEKLELVPAELVIRQSCGCLSGYSNSEKLLYERVDGIDANTFYASRKIIFMQELDTLLSRSSVTIEKEQIEYLLDAFYLHISRGEAESLCTDLYNALIATVKRKTDVKFFQDVFTMMRNLFSPLLTSPSIIEKIENFFHKARLITTDIQIIQKTQYFVDSWKQSDQISIVGEELANIVEIQKLGEVIYRTFPSFYIRNFLFAEYLQGSDGKEKARLIALIRDGVPYKSNDNNIIYSPQQLFPSDELAFRSNLYFVLPLMCQGERLGYVIYEKIEGQQILYSIITRELAKSFYICKQIKKRKDAEETLKALAANLEFKNRELQDFAHIASHDLQEPLRKIMVFGNRLKNALQNGATETEMDYFERMLHATTRMQDLITGLLEYSRVTTRAQSFSMVDLNSIVDEVLNDLERRINKTKGKVKVGQLPSITADPLQMRQLFQNLIGNGLTYHKKDIPPLIVIESAIENKYHKVTITDNGIGFDQKDSERIFGIFQRAVGKDEYEGTGAGPAICKKIVELHGGSITAFGELGKGSIFTIRIPLISISHNS